MRLLLMRIACQRSQLDMLKKTSFSDKTPITVDRSVERQLALFHASDLLDASVIPPAVAGVMLCRITRSPDRELSTSLMPAGSALVCWVLSFYPNGNVQASRNCCRKLSRPSSIGVAAWIFIAKAGSSIGLNTPWLPENYSCQSLL